MFKKKEIHETVKEEMKFQEVEQSEFTLSEYQNQAITTKIYRDEVALSYVVLGLVGEVAEMKEKSITLIEKGFDPLVKREFAKEVGDVAWYIAAIASETKQDLGKFGTIQLREASRFNLEKSIDNVVISAGSIAEVMKKALRDNYEEISVGKIPEEKLIKINNALRELIIFIQDVCYIAGLSFEKVLKENIEKLQSRKERQQLSGSGDNR